MKLNALPAFILTGLISHTLAGPLQEAKVYQIVNEVKVVAPREGAHTATLQELIKNDLGVATGIQSRAELIFQDNTLTRLGAETFFTFESGTRNLNLDRYFDAYDQPGGVRALERFRFSIDANLILAPKAIPPQLRGFLTRGDRSMAGSLSTAPALGYYEAGQRIPHTPTLGKASDFICTAGGKPGTWNETGKISPWPVGSTACVDIPGDKASLTLDIPSESHAFVALLSVSGRTGSQSSAQRATAAYVLALAGDTLTSSLLHSSPAGRATPNLVSLHFGGNSTGSPTRSGGAGGQFTAVFENISRGSAEASIELLHLGR